MRTPDARARLTVASSTGRGRARFVAGSEWGGRVLVHSARPHAAGVSRAAIVARDGGHPGRDGVARSCPLTVMQAERARDGGSRRRSGTRNTASRPRTPRMIDATATTPHQVYIEHQDTSNLQADSDVKTSGGGDAEKPPDGLWPLLILSLVYLHCNACGFVVPALLPQVMGELGLNDNQGAAVTLSYTAVYSLGLLPVGWLADKMPRPPLLALSISMWSAATLCTAYAPSFWPLAGSRMFFALGNAAMNPVAFGMIPELFPKRKSLATAIYNLSIHAGRAGAFLAGGMASAPLMGAYLDSDVWSFPGLLGIPLDKLNEAALAIPDLSVLYLSGNQLIMAPSVPNFETTESLYAALGGTPWREIISWIAAPALLLVPLMALTVRDPKKKAHAAAAAALAVEAPRKEEEESKTTAAVGVLGEFKDIWSSSAFQMTTLAAMLNDFGGWTLIAWQPAFYERVHHLPVEVYSHQLAIILPLGGVLGGIGGGAVADFVAERYPEGRKWLLQGSAALSAPLLAASMLAPDPNWSMALLFPGFMLSEVFRAPTSMMIQETCDPSTKTTAVASHLCARNLIGGLGPVVASALSTSVGLQTALLIAPASYLLSAVGFGQADKLVREQNTRGAAA